MTTHGRDDETVRAALDDLRREERVGAPPFQSILERRPGHRSPLALSPVLARAVAAALVLLAAGAAYRAIVAPPPPHLTVPHEVVALAAWRPTTDALLATPGNALLRASPILGVSLLGATPVLDTRSTGAQR